MFCSNCGKELQTDASFCQYYGAQCKSSDFIKQPTQQEMMQKLKRFKELKKCTCLECGYSGLMGVVKEQELSKKDKKTIWTTRIVAILVFLFILPGSFLFGLILGGILGCICVAVESSCKKKILFCPSCDREVCERK